MIGGNTNAFHCSYLEVLNAINAESVGIQSPGSSSSGTSDVHSYQKGYNFVKLSGYRRNLKQDIRDLPYFGEVHRMRPVLYKPKGGGDDYAGFIAEEIEEACPLLATYETDGAILGVQYERVCAYLVAEAQQAKRERDEMRMRLEAVERGIA